jgi:hypothetical protein
METEEGDADKPSIKHTRLESALSERAAPLATESVAAPLWPSYGRPVRRWRRFQGPLGDRKEAGRVEEAARWSTGCAVG